MSHPVAPSPSTEGNLTLLDLVPTQVGCQTVNLYPWKVGQRTEERAHAFHVNMNVLNLLPIETRLILNALGRSLNCSAVAEGLMFDWTNHFIRLGSTLQTSPSYHFSIEGGSYLVGGI
jgi:hypothetical protein